ncbi:Geranylgeranyl diphosphate synthase [uncultured archaeon]|nr:Geranylgeranyl diphosphate synthase [uncultured archaeon]
MNFKEYIELHRKEVYSKICDYVQVKEPAEHYGIMRDYIDRQGSYRRPGLILLCGQLFGASIEDLLLPAAAEQLSEDWILMQDDVEDDSDLRRGKPAAQKLYGWIHTINATNIGQMAMWQMLKDYMEKKPGIGGKVYDKFYDMIAYTIDGQFIENKFIHDTKDISKASEELYFRILDSKTCYYTVYGPMQIGAMVAGQDARTLDALREIGKPAGIAFQIADDILDMTADEKVFGKKNFGDLYEGKLTLIMLHAYGKATQDEKSRIDSIYKKKRQDKTDEDIGFLREVIAKYDGIGYAKETAKRYGQMAAEAMQRHSEELPNNEYKQLMMSAIEELYVRNK